MLQWNSFRYRRTFLFVLDPFYLPWRDVRPQLQCIYPYLLMILEWNPKLLVPCGMLLLNIQLVKCELSPYFSLLRLPLLDIRAIYAYILWLSLFSLLSHTRLPFSLKRTCLRLFSLSFGGLGYFVIMLSSDPHLKHFWGGRSVFLLDETSTARAFFFYFLILLKHFPAEWLLPPQNVQFFWTTFALSLFLLEPELLSRFS